MQDFHGLDVWHRAHTLNIAIYRLTRGFPRTGYSSLKTQLTKTAHSIPSTIVEGCGASTNKEFARFLDISIKSANELEYHLLVAHDLGLIPPKIWRALTRETVEIRKMLCGLRQRVLNRSDD
jgi:four helix bundle protein